MRNPTICIGENKDSDQLHLFYCSLLSEYMIYIGKNIFELKSTSSLLNFDTKTEASTPVINVIHDEFKRYPEFNKTKVWEQQIFIRYNMISGKKHQKPRICCWFAFICTKTAVVTSLLRLLRKQYFLRENETNSKDFVYNE